MTQRLINYEFRDASLLRQALTHRSAGAVNNERLEFLGDGILNFVVAESVFAHFTDVPEGDLSRLRAKLVRKETLVEIARELGLGDHIHLGVGERKSGGKRRDSILADSVEALLGAVYLDGGFEAARTLIIEWFGERVRDLPPAEALKDPKTRLQEMLQGRSMALPNYQLMESTGADHAQTFTVECHLPGTEIRTQASGSSIRKAEQAAAKLAIDTLR